MNGKTLMEYLEQWAPVTLAESWDNPGLLVGDGEAEVKKVLVALDVTDAVLDEAENLGANWIVTHHPMLFSAMKQITTSTPNGRRILRMAKAGIQHYAMHTNLDIAFGGTNDVLAQVAGLTQVEVLSPSCEQNGKENGLGRIGMLPKPMAFCDFAEALRKALGLTHINIVGDRNRQVQRVALCTGSGMDFLLDAAHKGADVYISGDIRFHESQKALDAGICLIDATHYASEVLIVPVIVAYLEQHGVPAVASQVNGQVFDVLG